MKKLLTAVFIIGFVCFSTSSQAISRELYRGYFTVDYSRDYKRPSIFSIRDIYNPLGLKIVPREIDSYGGIDKEGRYYQYTKLAFKPGMSMLNGLDALNKCSKSLKDSDIYINISTYMPRGRILTCKDYGTKNFDVNITDYLKVMDFGFISSQEYIINPKWSYSKRWMPGIRNIERIESIRNHNIDTKAKIYISIRNIRSRENKDNFQGYLFK
jgi:hypothetical protein